jgi:hypothetical protein
MGNLNMEYLLQMTLEDGSMSFQAAHDARRFLDWQQAGPDPRITVEPDPELGVSHAAHVEVETTDGRQLAHHVAAIPGSAQNPMTREDVESKARGLMTPVLGADRTAGLIEGLGHLDGVDDVRYLTSLLSK